MYTGFFGLQEAPFSITPDPRYLYLGAHHREALAHLLYGVGDGGGFVQLTGEIGTGKTTLCRSLLEQLPPEVDVALILNPKLTAVELLATVCDELRIEYPPGTTSVKILVDALYAHLLESHGRGRRTVLVIDEAQNLDVDVLEQVRLLTNLETAREKLLQIILIGQPELGQLLEGPRLRQLAQRITARYHLEPLSAEETRAYVGHRIDVAGRTDMMRRHEPIFSDAAIAEVHRLSGGIPRLINVLCDRALLGAYAEDQSQVDVATVRRGATEVLGKSGRRARARASVWVAGSVAAAAVAVALTSLVAPEPVRRLRDSVAPGLAGGLTAPVAAPRRPASPAPTPVLATITPAAGSSASTVGDSGPPASLATVLADPAVSGDRDAAFAALYAQWGLDLGAGGDSGCDRARRDGLGCLVRTGTWTKLRRVNLPAVIELATPQGDRRHALVTALGADRATLELGGTAYTFPLAEIDPFWDGPFIVLWKPAVGTTTLQPGARGKEVEWLRRRLSELDGQPVGPRNRDLYDDDLKARVIAFQQSRALVPDGIAGEETLVHLSAGPGTPTIRPLAGPGPRR
jgi:general secretion pathway protein A